MTLHFFKAPLEACLIVHWGPMPLSTATKVCHDIVVQILSEESVTEGGDEGFILCPMAVGQ